MDELSLIGDILKTDTIDFFLRRCYGDTVQGLIISACPEEDFTKKEVFEWF